MSPSSAIKAEIATETKKRRTFAIISHPDAGKTTLTEKLLLYSGMLRTAGMVGGRKGKAAASDWMSLEQERGISITASAMQFSYKDTIVNVLDTPGHQDFSEDTYRTITAADSVIMVLDAAKGVEAQTRKLFEACRIRSIPVITFVNKMDLPNKDLLDLLSEVEEVLGIQSCPLNWPIGGGKEFKGILNRKNKEIHLYTRTGGAGSSIPDVEVLHLDSLVEHHSLSSEVIENLKEEIELLDEAGNTFTQEDFLAGKITPVFFGSAMINYGVEPLFDAFIDLAPCPSSRPADEKDSENELIIDPVEEPFSAYVFKLQANMNPRHRDCVAFLRINSGRYEKEQQVKHMRLGKKIRLSRPHSLQVSQRNTLEKAYPGDIIGIINSGHFKIGDTITTGTNFTYKPLPMFQPEIFASVRPLDMGKRKAIDKGMEQLAAEGAIQMIFDAENDGAFPLVGAVGWLQFEVLQYRLKDEYGVKTEVNKLPYTCSAWVFGDMATLKKPTGAKFVKDQYERLLLLFSDQWEKNYAIRENPDHEFRNFA
ncbi:MAG: peptide chain release factor 3 [Planctomycetes bacterium]|nr:peptide chain release factor 3 [Planctomycetota bacterium]